MFREDFRDYPPEAVREVLINAVVHRDYSIRGNTLVTVFGNKVTVSSIGGLNRGLSKEDTLLGVSSCRNENLARVLCRLNVMENHGTGIPRIMRLYEGEPLLPFIEATAGAFKITLPKVSKGKLSREAIAAMDLFSEYSSVGRSDIEEKFNVSKTKAYSVIIELESNGYIVREGAGRSTVYRKRT